MTGVLYRRLQELRRVLQFHFSDLGEIVDFQFDFKPILFWGSPFKNMVIEESLPLTPSQIAHSHGELFTIQVKFKSFDS